MEKAPKQYSELSKAAKRRERRKRVDRSVPVDAAAPKSVPVAEKPVKSSGGAAPVQKFATNKHAKKAILINQICEETIIPLDETNAKENWLAHHTLSSKIREGLRGQSLNKKMITEYHDLTRELQLATPEDQPEAPECVELPPDFERLEFEMHHGYVYGQCKHCQRHNTKFALSIFRLDEFIDHVANGHTMRRVEYAPGTGMLPVEPVRNGYINEEPAVKDEPFQFNAEAPEFVPRPVPTKVSLKGSNGFTVFTSSLGWQ